MSRISSWISIYYPHEHYKSKIRKEVKGTGLGGEELSENEQLLEDSVERFEESERRTEADAQKTQSDIENKKKKTQELRKKAMERFRGKKDIRCKIKVTLEIKK